MTLYSDYNAQGRTKADPDPETLLIHSPIKLTTDKDNCYSYVYLHNNTDRVTDNVRKQTVASTY